jgi:hypothetical protein
MIVGGVAIGALSIASAFTLFQFMRRGSGPSSDPASESSSKSTPITESGSESETILETRSETGSESVQESGSDIIVETESGSETIVELETGSHENLYERPYERPFERPSLGLSIGPSVGPSVNLPAEPVSVTSDTSNPPTYLSIDPAHIDEFTQFLAALKKRPQGAQLQ